jgi:hypothetical protein
MAASEERIVNPLRTVVDHGSAANAKLLQQTARMLFPELFDVGKVPVISTYE